MRRQHTIERNIDLHHHPYPHHHPHHHGLAHPAEVVSALGALDMVATVLLFDGGTTAWAVLGLNQHVKL